MSAPISVGRSPRQEAWRRFKKNPLAVVFLGVFVLFFLMASSAQIVEFIQHGTASNSSGVSGPSFQQTLHDMGVTHSNGEPFVEGKHPPSSVHSGSGAGSEVTALYVSGTSGTQHLVLIIKRNVCLHHLFRKESFASPQILGSVVGK